MPRQSQRRFERPEGYHLQREEELKVHKSSRKERETSTKNVVKYLGIRWDKFCEYLKLSNVDSHSVLLQSDAGRYKHFFEWLLDESDQISSVDTMKNYWKLIQMLHIDYTEELNGEGVSIRKTVNDEIGSFIANDLTKAPYYLSKVPSEKPIFTRDDIFALLHYHWCFDTTSRPIERYRVQFALVSLLLGVSAARLGTIVESSCHYGSDEALKYKDICVSLVRRADGEPYIQMEVRMRLYKGNRNLKKSIPVIFVFTTKRRLVTCPIILMLGMAFADSAFKFLRNPEDLALVEVTACRQATPLEWKQSMLETPIFREAEDTGYGKQVSPTTALKSWTFSDDLKATALCAGFEENVTSKAIRRGNANSLLKENVPLPVMTKVLGHYSTSVFQNHYQSGHVLFDTASAYWGEAQDKELISNVSKMCLHMDPRAPKDISIEEEQAAYLADSKLQALLASLESVRQDITKTLKFRYLYLAKGTRQHKGYVRLQGQVRIRRRQLRRIALMEKRRKFFEAINEDDFRRVFAGQRPTETGWIQPEYETPER